MGEHLVARNKKAFHDYEILEEFEAGIVLTGTEVKSLREGRVNLKESYGRIRDGELWLEGCNISPYTHGNRTNHEPLRPRKLLLHKKEINRLTSFAVQRGLTIVPLSLYFKSGKAKLKIGLAKGKRLHDKRETERRKTIEREIQTEMKWRKR